MLALLSDLNTLPTELLGIPPVTYQNKITGKLPVEIYFFIFFLLSHLFIIFILKLKVSDSYTLIVMSFG